MLLSLRETLRQTRAKTPIAKLQAIYSKGFHNKYPTRIERDLRTTLRTYLENEIVRPVEVGLNRYYETIKAEQEYLDADNDFYRDIVAIRKDVEDDEKEMTRNGLFFLMVLSRLDGVFANLTSFSVEEFERFLAVYIPEGFKVSSIPNQDKIKESFKSDIRIRVKRLYALYFDKVFSVFNDFKSGKEGLDDLKRKIEKFGTWLAVSVSAFIARDIIGSFYSRLQGAIANALGLRFYTWQTAGDERVRGNPDGLYPNAPHSHYDMDGLLCDAQNPALISRDWGKTWVQKTGRLPIAHPGEEYNCRCVRVPYINGLLQSIDQRR